MTKDLATKLFESNSEEFELRTNYSGRGMFGETTHGVVADRSKFQNAQIHLATKGKLSDNDIEELALLRSDNMGKSDLIFY